MRSFINRLEFDAVVELLEVHLARARRAARTASAPPRGVGSRARRPHHRAPLLSARAVDLDAPKNGKRAATDRAARAIGRLPRARARAAQQARHGPGARDPRGVPAPRPREEPAHHVARARGVPLRAARAARARAPPRAHRRPQPARARAKAGQLETAKVHAFGREIEQRAAPSAGDGAPPTPACARDPNQAHARECAPGARRGRGARAAPAAAARAPPAGSWTSSVVWSAELRVVPVVPPSTGRITPVTHADAGARGIARRRPCRSRAPRGRAGSPGQSRRGRRPTPRARPTCATAQSRARSR